jgi:phage terminase large subunit
VEGKLDIKPFKEKMNKLIQLDHDHDKRALNLVISSLKEKKEDTLALVKEELQNKLHIETTCLIEAKSPGKILEHKDSLIHVKVNCNDHKCGILSKTPSLKGLKKFINEDPISEDQVELRKEVQNVKEASKQGKWAIIRNRKASIRNSDQKYNNK